MPSPSSQNLRSAPQKQPMPNIAVSKPAGYGPLSAAVKMKCSRAVGIGVGRPGSASAADGISGFFLNVNMARSPRTRRLYIGQRVQSHGRAYPITRLRSVSSQHGSAMRVTIAGVADERLLLASENDQERPGRKDCPDSGAQDAPSPDPTARLRCAVRAQTSGGLFVDLVPESLHGGHLRPSDRRSTWCRRRPGR